MPRTITGIIVLLLIIISLPRTLYGSKHISVQNNKKYVNKLEKKEEYILS